MNSKPTEEVFKKRNYNPAIITITIVLISAIFVLLGLPGIEGFDAFDITILPMMNAIFNVFSFLLLIGALIAILKGNVKIHRRFIYAAIGTTCLFLVSNVFFHIIASSTSIVVGGFITIVYYFILISRVTLSLSIIT